MVIIGINVAQNRYWSTALQFKNLCKQAQPWWIFDPSHSNPWDHQDDHPETDRYGYPTKNPRDGTSYKSTVVNMHTDDGETTSLGRMKIRFLGEGTLLINGVTVIGQEGEMLIGNSHIDLTITALNELNPIKNIEITLEPRPWMLEDEFPVIRWMDQNSMSSTVDAIPERRLEDYTWAPSEKRININPNEPKEIWDGGTPVEEIVRRCKQPRMISPWFCLHPNLFRECAQEIFSPLATKIITALAPYNPIFELGNEPWNTALLYGYLLYHRHGNGDFEAGLRHHVGLSNKAFMRVKAISPEATFVIGSQNASPWVTEFMLNEGALCDAVAVAPYGLSAEDVDWSSVTTVEKLLRRLSEFGPNVDKLDEHRAKFGGKKIFVYECNLTHLFNVPQDKMALVKLALQSREGKTLVRKYLDAIASKLRDEEVMCWYNDIQRWTSSGFWGRKRVWDGEALFEADVPDREYS